MCARYAMRIYWTPPHPVRDPNDRTKRARTGSGILWAHTLAGSTHIDYAYEEYIRIDVRCVHWRGASSIYIHCVRESETSRCLITHTHKHIKNVSNNWLYEVAICGCRTRKGASAHQHNTLGAVRISVSHILVRFIDYTFYCVWAHVAHSITDVRQSRKCRIRIWKRMLWCVWAAMAGVFVCAVHSVPCP